MQIRQANLADAAFIRDSNLRLAGETERRQLDPARVAAGVNALLSDPAKGVYYLAECAGRPAGQLLVTYEWSDWRNGNFWWIQSVYVAQAFRGTGIFRALFAHVLALAQTRSDVCGLRLYTDAHNLRAKQIYRRLGMKPTNYEMFEMDFTLNPPA
jgi:GNAT superfamily N-acetyltransferase